MNRLARIFLQDEPCTTPDAAVPAAAPAPAAGASEWLPPVPVCAAPIEAPAAVDAPGIAVVCAPRDARVAGAATGLALARAVQSPCVLVLEWGAPAPRPGPERPAVPAARRLAARLEGTGHVARAAGRLTVVQLPPEEADAMRVADRLASTDVPTVIVVAGPRGAATEALMAQCGAIVLLSRPAADEQLAALAASELGRLGPRVLALDLALSPVASWLARGGIGRAASLRGPLVGALGAVVVSRT